jgi:hypothetical protein
VYHAGGAGGSLHTLVTGKNDMLGPHSAELTPGVATTATAIDAKATAITAAKRPNNLMAGLPAGPSRSWLASAYAFDTAATRHLHRRPIIV